MAVIIFRRATKSFLGESVLVVYIYIYILQYDEGSDMLVDLSLNNWTFYKSLEWVECQ